MTAEHTPVAIEDLEKIVSYLPYFSQEEAVGQWEGGRSDDGAFQMPHVTYDEKVYIFQRLLYDSDFTVVFDWGSWDEGRELTKHRDQIAQADLLTLRMLMTAIVRNERFCEGAFLSAVEDGLVTDILRRLKVIIGEGKKGDSVLLKKDQFVFNPNKSEWGIGKVIEIENQDRARVFFQYGGYRLMVRKTNPLIPADTKNLDMAIFDNLSKNGAEADTERHFRDIPSSISFFLEEFPGGFNGEKYHEWERDYKDEGCSLANELLNQPKYESLLSKEKYSKITTRALKVVNKLNLIFPNEKMALKDGLKSEEAQKKFAHSLYALLYGKDELENRFEGWIRMLESIGAGKWTVATYFLFVAHPDKYMFVKPTVTQKVADLSAFDISYTPKLNWNTYSKVLKLSEYLKQELCELKPKDMIDVQSFMWCINRTEEEDY